MKQTRHSRMKKDQRTPTAAFLLIVFLSSVLLPAVAGLLPLPAYAQQNANYGSNIFLSSPGSLGSGGGGVGGGGSFGGGGGLLGRLGGLVGKLFERPVLLALLVALLSQLFQGGGATPQTGPAEEQPPIFPPSVGPTRTGPKSGQGTEDLRIIPPPSKGTFQYVSLTGGTLYPAQTTIPAGGSITVVNAEKIPQTLGFRRTGGTQYADQQTLPVGGAHTFRFPNVGTYDICLITAPQTATCPASVTTL